ncbi:MAG: hypothetical protein JXA95_09195 [Spirochaetales bacterium]|nr:hypothetical protein [Spirochaetales bacterium]
MRSPVMGCGRLGIEISVLRYADASCHKPIITGAGGQVKGGEKAILWQEKR